MKLLSLRSCCLAALALWLAGSEALQATVYYIDYEAGNDSNPGTTTGTPWKHCPGDANATGTARSVTLAPGDTVNFKGGVRYEGAIAVTASGTAGSPITFQGQPSGWGAGRAIVDGSVAMTNAWTRCTSADEVGGNPNYANIWFANTAYAGQTFWHTIIVSNTILPFAQDFTPERPIFWDAVHNGYTNTAWTNITASGNITTTTLRDSGYFTSPDPDYFANSWIAVWVEGNWIAYSEITGFNPSTDTINYNLAGSSFYSTAKYTILNNLRDINYAGEYAVHTNRVYMWPTGGGNPNNQPMRVAKLGYAFWIQGRQFVTIDGFQMQGAYNPPGGSYGAAAVVHSGAGTSYDGIKIINNDAAFMRCMVGGPVIYALNMVNLVVANNTIRGCLRSRGMIVSGWNVTIASNRLDEISATGIYCAGVGDSFINSNHITNIRGVHGNGISLYQGSTNSVVAGNCVAECGQPITYERGGNLIFINNFVDSSYGSIEEWGGMAGYVYWFNNTFTGTFPGGGVHVRFWDATQKATYRVQNNIFQDAAPAASDVLTKNTYSHNMFLTTNRVSLPSDCIIRTDRALNFVNYPSNPRLRSTSQAIGMGTNVSEYVPRDFDGRPRGVTVDMGAFEFDSASNDGRPVSPVLTSVTNAVTSGVIRATNP